MTTNRRYITTVKGCDPFMKPDGIEFKGGRWLSDGKIALNYIDKNRLRTDGRPVRFTVVFTVRTTYKET